ncbi:MAG: lipopolysaccharide biosynthesis protein, partial [bacterium]
MIKKILRYKSSQLFINIKNYFTGSVLSKALIFLSIPILTRFLSPDEYGYLAIFNSLITVFVIIMPLGLFSSIRHITLKRNEIENSKEYLFVVFFFGYIFSIIFIIIIYFSRKFLYNEFNIRPLILYLAVVYSFFGISYEIYNRVLLSKNNSAQFATLSIFKGLFEFVVGIGLVILLNNNKYLGKIVGQILSISIISIYSVFKILKESQFSIDKKKLFFILSYSLPLIPHQLSYFILAQFDRLIINQLKGLAETGLYTLAYSFGMIIQMLVVSINNAWLPSLYKNLKIGNYIEIDKKITTLFMIISLLAVVLSFLSREIIYIMAPREYHDSIEIIPIILISSLFIYLYTTYGNYSFFHEKTIIISVNSFLAGGINIVLNYLLIEKYGYKIAAITTLISFMALFLLHYVYSRYILKE